LREASDIGIAKALAPGILGLLGGERAA
jgi:hypothetical protein